MQVALYTFVDHVVKLGTIYIIILYYKVYAYIKYETISSLRSHRIKAKINAMELLLKGKEVSIYRFANIHKF